MTNTFGKPTNYKIDNKQNNSSQLTICLLYKILISDFCLQLLLTSTPPRTPSPVEAKVTSVPVSVIMKVNKNGVCSSDPFGRTCCGKEEKSDTRARTPVSQSNKSISVSSTKVCDNSNASNGISLSTTHNSKSKALDSDCGSVPLPCSERFVSSQNVLKSIKFKMSKRKEQIVVVSKDTFRQAPASSESSPQSTPSAQPNSQDCSSRKSTVPQQTPQRNIAIAPKPYAQAVILSGGTLIPVNSSSGAFMQSQPVSGSFIPVAATSQVPAKAVVLSPPGSPEAPKLCPSFVFFTANPSSVEDKDHSSTDPRRRIFECDFEGCGKNYFKSSHLKAHMRTHTGNWFSCLYCNHIEIFQNKTWNFVETFSKTSWIFQGGITELTSKTFCLRRIKNYNLCRMSRIWWTGTSSASLQEPESIVFIKLVFSS